MEIIDHDFPKFVKEKGARIIHNICAHAHAKLSHSSHAHVLHAKASHVRRNVSHAKIPHMPHVKYHNASKDPLMSYHTFGASYVLMRKYGKVMAKFVGSRHRNTKSYV